MYTDPTRIRSNVVKIRLSDQESRLIDALTDYTGEQKATLLRDLILERAADILAIEPGPYEGAAQARLGL